jgi:hypothetical protein
MPVVKCKVTAFWRFGMKKYSVNALIFAIILCPRQMFSMLSAKYVLKIVPTLNQRLFVAKLFKMRYLCSLVCLPQSQIIVNNNKGKIIKNTKSYLVLDLDLSPTLILDDHDL